MTGRAIFEFRFNAAGRRVGIPGSRLGLTGRSRPKNRQGRCQRHAQTNSFHLPRPPASSFFRRPESASPAVDISADLTGPLFVRPGPRRHSPRMRCCGSATALLNRGPRWSTERPPAALTGWRARRLRGARIFCRLLTRFKSERKSNCSRRSNKMRFRVKNVAYDDFTFRFG